MPDGIDQVILQKVSKSLFQKLPLILRASLVLGYIPKTWTC